MLIHMTYSLSQTHNFLRACGLDVCCGPPSLKFLLDFCPCWGNWRYPWRRKRRYWMCGRIVLSQQGKSKKFLRDKTTVTTHTCKSMSRNASIMHECMHATCNLWPDSIRTGTHTHTTSPHVLSLGVCACLCNICERERAKSWELKEEWVSEWVRERARAREQASERECGYESRSQLVVP